MQKKLSLLVLLFSLVSCYTYQVKKPVELPVDDKKESKKSPAVAEVASVQESSPTVAKNNPTANPQPTVISINVQGKLAAGKNFRIDADGKTYKIIVDKWVGDTLVAHPVRQKDVVLKFHKNQINADRIAEKRFSQPIADILTVVAYVGIGVGIYALIKGM
ncbi:hypothetical protein [Chryseobacterium sp.]|uniref:hypothetical protein n=1 Tax=Chryseobacterium sp. TaxID=1871047 RepID=UPI0028A24A7C|nr:hypothetical protein [Chryseobacterium sp.]